MSIFYGMLRRPLATKVVKLTDMSGIFADISGPNSVVAAKIADGTPTPAVALAVNTSK